MQHPGCYCRVREELFGFANFREAFFILRSTTVAKGKTDLRVATPRNAHSQENRNVHIELE